MQNFNNKSSSTLNLAKQPLVVHVPCTSSFKNLHAEKPKKEFFMTTFGVFFKDSYFKNNLFQKEIKEKYKEKFLS